MGHKKLNEKKLQLEIKKAKYEINNLKKENIYKLLQLILSLLIFLAGGVSVYYLSNVYDLKNERLLLEKEELSYDIKKFSIKKDSLIKVTNSLTNNTKKLNDTILSYKENILRANNSLTTINQDNIRIRDRNDSLKHIVLFLSDSLANLTILYQNYKWLLQKKDSDINEILKEIADNKEIGNIKRRPIDELKELFNNQNDTTRTTFSLYPNPTTDHISIAINVKDSNSLTIVELRDISGRKLTSYQFYGPNSKLLKLPKLPSGLYLVFIKSEGYQIIQKLIIN